MIEYCAPTLAGLKTGNLFSYYFSSAEEAEKDFFEVNEKLNAKGVFVEALLWRPSSVLVYAYRKTFLDKQLKMQEVKGLLSGFGYNANETEECLDHLKKRLAERKGCGSFPHEIGIFLGYPLTDVIGFIANRGENCKFCGLWKVYSDEDEARKLFEKLKKCTGIYLKLFLEGRSIAQMTVAA